MKLAFQKDSAFVFDVGRVLDYGGKSLWWLGQSGFLIAQNGRAILLDPYLSDSLTKKYANTDKPHVRITERVVDPSFLGAACYGKIGLITSSHNHTDHFDPGTLIPIVSALDFSAPLLIVPAANRDVSIERLGGHFSSRLKYLDDGTSTTIGDIEIHGIAAAHNTVERDENGHCRFLGYVIRWGPLTLYHSGDTLLHDQLVPSLRRFEIDLALLPINGDKPERRVAGNLDGPQAAKLAHDIGARCVIPCHYDMFEFNTATPDEFVAACARLNQKCHVLRNGEGWDFSPLLS
jgi:L-ascorbate metabolism protein UlaG (beta-lactamase superfamily)